MRFYTALLRLLVIAIIMAMSAGCATVPLPNETTPTPLPPVTTVPATPLPGNETACMQDNDCVPAQCCHPTSCINAAYAPNCTGVVCTLSCEGPIDCGAGHCGCVNGTCSVVPGPASTTQY